MMENEEEFDSLTAEKKLLYASRNGHVRIVEELLQQKRAGEIELDVNCRGTSRANKGWSPLHLSTYFGHKDVVQLLLEGGADVNTQNNMGDTPLHRAAHTGREEVVMMLLNHGADVSIMNTDGKTAKYVATQNVQRLIEGSEQCDTRKIVDDFLTAALYGEVDTICELLKRPNAPAINCTDKFGNTALHMAALRNQKEVSILLLQNGIDSGIKNNKDKRAEEYTQAPQMKQLLKVQPVRDIQSIPSRCEGPLLKKSRFFGFKMFWVVLEKGVMSYFNNKGDARTGSRRKGMKCLYEATVESFSENSLQFRIHFSDGTYHTLCTDPLKGDFIVRQHWLNSLNEHTAYSNHYMQQSEISDDDKDDEIVPLGSLLESLQIAQAHQQLLDQQLTNVSCLFNNLETQNPKTANFLLIHQNFCQILGTSHEMYAALSCSLKMFNNQDKVRELQLMQEREKSRVLQEALHALATEHHELEQSISTRNFPRRFYDTDDDEFYDCDNDIQSSDSIADFTSVNDDAFFESCSNCTSTPDSSLMPQGNTSNAAFWLFPYGPQRTNLPKPMFSRNDFSIWSILKQCIGKELSKITMPVIFNEPLSFLQRISEYMEYATLLQKANSIDDPVERMQYVCAFAVSSVSSNWERIGKPFNPLLGETFELERPDLGFRLITEQVSHHPPISAFQVESSSFRFHGSIHPKLRFWGKSVEVNPKGIVTLELLKYGEVYTWQNVNCCVHNVIVGKLWVEHYGVMEVLNHKTKHKGVLTFKQNGWFGRDLHKVEGTIYDSEKTRMKSLVGSWVHSLYAVDVSTYESFLKTSAKNDLQVSSRTNGASSSGDRLKLDFTDSEDIPKTVPNYDLKIPNQVCLWKTIPRPDNNSKYFSFTLFAMMLNELTENIIDKLPPTDARLRPDIRKLEEGQIDGAAAEKNRLEEKQRAARRDRKKRREDWNSVWFHYGTNPHTGKEDWIFNGDYWQRDWSRCPDIF